MESRQTKQENKERGKKISAKKKVGNFQIKSKANNLKIKEEIENEAYIKESGLTGREGPIQGGKLETITKQMKKNLNYKIKCIPNII